MKKIASDFAGLWAVCGPLLAVRWLLAIVTHAGACRRSGDLQPADAVLSRGSVAVRKGAARALLTGDRALTGIREVWVRDVYLGRGFLFIAPDAVVVDLGANMGAVTTLALAHGSGVRVVAVEADPAECLRLQRNLQLNGWTDRAMVINAFVGGSTQIQNELVASGRCESVSTVGVEELLGRVGGKINLLKCDIEGSEFELFSAGSPLLPACEQIAMELHPHAGDPEIIMDLLRGAGFELQTRFDPPTVTVLARRRNLRG